MPKLLLLFAVCVSLVITAWGDEVTLETDSVSQDYEQELPRSAPTAPDASLSKFQLVDGFALDLVVTEPLIVDPVSMAFDEFGRLFVVCMQGYSEHRDDRLGSVRLLEDRDGDGCFERMRVYVSELRWPTAVACYDGGVFIGDAPDIWYCKDTDDDGVADIRERVWTGFGHQNVQGMLNSFRWGVDNRLYGAAGTNGGQVSRVGSAASAISLRGRDFSLDPNARELRPESGGAQHGATFDRWGNRFVCSNSDHLQWVEFDDQHLQRNSRLEGYASRRSIAVDGPAAEVYRTSDVEPWRIVRTRLRVKGLVRGPVEGGGRAAGYFTSASGVTAYTGDAFSEPYARGDYIFVGDVGSNLVHLKRIDTKGLTKQAVRATADQTEFLTSTDNWFRPVQFANGPDGCLYVMDMYRETIEHPLSLPPMIKRHVDLNSGRDRGRIYRVRSQDWQPHARSLPGNATDAQLVAMLSHSNGWHRETAARLIVQRGRAAERRDQLVELLADHLADANPLGSVRAMYCLQSLGQLDEGHLLRRLEDTNAQVRRHAVKLVESVSAPSDVLVQHVAKMVDEPDLGVRYQLALTLGSWPWEERALPLTQLARSATDAKMRFAILSSMADQRLPLLQGMLAERPWPASALELARTIARQIGRSRADVRAAVNWLRPQPNTEPLLAELLLGIGLRGNGLLEFLHKQQIANAQQLVSDILNVASLQALDDRLGVRERQDAITLLTLGDFPSSEATFRRLLQSDQPATIRDAAVEAAGSFDSPEAARLLIVSLPSLPPLGRRRALESLTSRVAWSQQLLDAVQQDQLDQEQVAARYRQSLRQHRDPGISQLAAKVFGAQSDRARVVEEMTSWLGKKGDPVRGRAAFEKVCASCHRLDEIGATVGPDLQPLRNRGAEFMLVNILDPNREVDPRYEAYVALTDDGRTHSGILVRDSGEAIELLEADGKQVTLAKNEVEQFQATGRSLMPDGLEQELKPQGIADVIAYLIQSSESERN